jgi:hypothetical protein
MAQKGIQRGLAATKGFERLNGRTAAACFKNGLAELSSSVSIG